MTKRKALGRSSVLNLLSVNSLMFRWCIYIYCSQIYSDRVSRETRAKERWIESLKAFLSMVQRPPMIPGTHRMGK